VDKANICQGDKLSTALNDIGLNLLFVLVVLERESSKGVDAFRPAEFWNGEVDKSYAKSFAIKVEILARYIKVLLLRPILLLFRKIVYDASRLFSTETFRVN
jgi:hypothetical protein